MTTQLMRRDAGLMTGDWKAMVEQARGLIASRLLPDTIDTPEKAIVVAMTGRELGIPTMAALRSINVIKGKPACSAELMAALIYRDHGNESLIITDSSDTVCTIDYKRPGWNGYKSFSFTIEDAKKAGLTANAMYSKYPKAMLRSRALSAVAKMAFQDSCLGLYTPEELDAPVSVDEETGEIVNHPAAIAPAAPARALPHPSMAVHAPMEVHSTEPGFDWGLHVNRTKAGNYIVKGEKALKASNPNYRLTPVAELRAMSDQEMLDLTEVVADLLYSASEVDAIEATA